MHFYEVNSPMIDASPETPIYFRMGITNTGHFTFHNLATGQDFSIGDKVELLPKYPAIFGKRTFYIIGWSVDASSAQTVKRDDKTAKVGYKLLSENTLFLRGIHFDWTLMAIVGDKPIDSPHTFWGEELQQHVYMHTLRLKEK